MRTPAFPALQSRYDHFADRSHAIGFFRTHAVGEVIRSVFLSSLLWLLLAGTVYTVYSMIAGSHAAEQATHSLIQEPPQW